MDSLRYLTAGCWLENLGSSQHLSSSHRLDWIHYMAFSGQRFERMSESYKMSWHLDSVIHTTSLLLHSVGQGQFSVQPRLKGWRNRLHLLRGELWCHCQWMCIQGRDGFIVAILTPKPRYWGKGKKAEVKALVYVQSPISVTLKLHGTSESPISY